jgi:hypothetical protein
MSNVKSDQLFKLIHSLSKGEKRFFKIYTTRINPAGDKKFIRLFDAIEKQAVYDEPAILRKEKSLIPAQISNMKAHLYSQLLKSLRLLNASKEEHLELTMYLDYPRILYNKCLYKECVKMLDKAKLLAIENNSSILLLEILDLEKLVIPKTIESGNQQRVNALIEYTNNVTESIRNGNGYSNLALKMNAFYVQTGFSKDPEDLAQIADLFQENIPDFDENSLSFQERLHMYNAYVGYFFYIQDFENGYTYARKLADLFHENPEMKQHKLEAYIKALNSLLVVLNKLRYIKEFEKCLRELTAIKRNKAFVLTENINLNLFKAIYVHQINRHFMRGQFTSGTRIVDALEDELNRFLPMLDKHSILIFYYKIACLFIGCGKFKIAVKWLNKIYNEKQIDLREDILAFTRILLLVCHYEMGNETLVESNIRSTYRYFSKKGQISEYQRNILAFVRYLFSDPSEKNVHRQFIRLKEKMLELENNPQEKKAFMYFDIISWLDSKIYLRPIELVTRENAEKRLRTVQTKNAESFPSAL